MNSESRSIEFKTKKPERSLSFRKSKQTLPDSPESQKNKWLDRNKNKPNNSGLCIEIKEPGSIKLYFL